MPTRPNVPARSGRSLYGLVRVAAPFVLAIATLAVGVLWVSTGQTPGAGAAFPVTLSHHDAVVQAARAERTGAAAARSSARTAARAPREAVRHALPAITSSRTTRPAPPHLRPGSPTQGSPRPSPSPTPTPQDAAPPPTPPPPAALAVPALPPLPPPPALPPLPQLPGLPGAP
jgi:hypothetical protein